MSLTKNDRRLRMFALGAQEHELTRCLFDTRKRLVAAGAKADNLPTKPEQEIRLVLGLKPAAMRIVREWFAKNAAFEEELDPAQACEQLSAANTLSDASLERQLWRAVLAAFVRDPMPEDVRSFLGVDELLNSKNKTVSAGEGMHGIQLNAAKKPGKRQEGAAGSSGKVPKKRAEERPAAKSKPKEEVVLQPKPRETPPSAGLHLPSSAEEQVVITEEDAALALSAAHGGVLQTTRLVPTLVAGLMAAARGDAAQATLCESQLARSNSQVARSFSPVIAEATRVRPTPKNYEGFVIQKPLAFSVNLVGEPERQQVLGCVTNQLPSGQFFVRIVGVLDGKQVVGVSHEQAKGLFPESGDATALPNSVKGHQARAEELSIWRIEHRSPDKNTQFVISGFLGRAYDVFHVPHPSCEPHKVREWLQTLYKARPHIFPVFQLADGLILRLSGDVTDPASVNYEMPLAAYRSHPAVAWHDGRTLVTTAFGVPDLKYDCAPLSTHIKRLFKSRADASGLPTVTRAQLQALTAFAAIEDDVGIIRESAATVQAHVAEIIDCKELLDDAVSQVLQVPEVQAELTNEKEKLLETFRKTAMLQNMELQGLEGKKKALVGELEQLEQERKQLGEELSSEIRKTFKRATEEGMQTLASASLTRVLVGHTFELAARADESKQGPLVAARIGSPDGQSPQQLGSVKELHDSLRRRAMRAGVSLCMLKTSVAALSTARGVIAIVGSRRQAAVLALAGVLGDGQVCSVSVTGDMFGPSDLLRAPALVQGHRGTRTVCLGDFLEQQHGCGLATVVDLRGANRAPPETFLLELLGEERGISALGWADKSGSLRTLQFNAPAIFLLDISAGKASFRMPRVAGWELPVVDTDAAWWDVQEPDDGVDLKDTVVPALVWSSLANQGTRPPQGALMHTLPSGARAIALRMFSASQALGAGPAEANVLAMVTLTVGRRELTAAAESCGGESMLHAFVASSQESASAGALGRLFETEAGTLHE